MTSIIDIKSATHGSKALNHTNQKSAEKPVLIKALRTGDDTHSTPLNTRESDALMVQRTRQPARNTAYSIHFILKGAEKRRHIAYKKAKTLQRELGVVPNLVSVK